MSDDITEPVTQDAAVETVDIPAGDIQVRSASLREIDMRIMPWGEVINSNGGTEEFARGAFEGTDPTRVMLIGPEHERHLALGHNGGPDLVRRPLGRGVAFEDRDDGAYMTFRVARTLAGDEVLALIEDGITPGVSVEFSELPGGTQTQNRAGRRHRVQQRARLEAVTTTYRPAYQRAAVLSVRSEEGEHTMPETPDTQPETPAPDYSPIVQAIQAQGETFTRGLESFAERFGGRLEAVEEQARSAIEIPGRGAPVNDRERMGPWLETVLQLLSGERPTQERMRTLDDLITTDNIGVVPEAFLTEIIGVVDPRRPFLNSTRRIDLPPVGMSLNVPKIVTRPETGVQAAEKDDIASNTTSITVESFDAVTIAGGGDISLQLLKRSGPSFLGLYLELLAESYAKNAEQRALAALYTGDTPGGTLDPEDANFGQAWKNGALLGQQVDTLWLSSVGVAAFINAKADGTNAPLYSSIQAGFTAGSGPAGTISGLRPVYVPQMDNVGDVDAIVGPSAGFAWTEDGTYTLQVDVPAKAGRDVAIVGMLWFAPMYPAAFTTYQIAS